MVTDVAPRSSSRLWEFATLAALIVAAVAIAVAYQEHGRIGQLSDSLNAATQHSAQLEQQLAQQATDLQRQSSVIQAQAADMHQQSAAMQAEAKPDLPLSYKFRAALFGTGEVMMLRNNSASDLDLAVTVSSGATGVVQRREIDVPANRWIQLGSQQGWSFVAGQRVVFTNVNFRPGAAIVR